MEKHERLREVRKRLSLTQKQMADLFGMCESGYSVIECGKRGIKSAYLDKLCSNYKISRQYIDDGIGDMFDYDSNRRLSMYDELTPADKILVINFIKALWTTEKFNKVSDNTPKKEI